MVRLLQSFQARTLRGTVSADRVIVPIYLCLSGAVLTCPNSTATQMHKLQLEVAGTVTVDASSRIDVSGKGYLTGRTSGHVIHGAATECKWRELWRARRHGCGGQSNPTYGDYFDPNDWAVVAPIYDNYTYGAGGGLARLFAGNLVLDGQSLRMA